MPNKIVLVTAIFNGIFLASGALMLGFSFIVQKQMNARPKGGRDAVRNLLYQDFPLKAGIANGAMVVAAFLVTLFGLMLPMTRRWLKLGGYMITVCGLFTLCIGVFLWVMTLQIKQDFSATYRAQGDVVQALIQASFNCCGYFNSTSPAFVTDSTCPSPAAAALLSGCATSISSFANVHIDNIFTAVFGVVGVDALLILCIACLLKDRKERERYRHIDEKSGYRQI